MGKGDGKKKRKKKSAAAPSPADSKPAAVPSPTPLRVSNDIGIPVRHQIRVAKMNKQLAKQSGSSFRQKKVTRTKYRRSWDEEEILEKAEERKRKGQDPDWSVILNRTAASPLMIVDGYNIIYKWPRLKKHMIKGDTGRARQLLVDDLEDLRISKGYRIEVVFDGAGKSIKGPLGDSPGNGILPVDRVAKKEISKNGVRVVYTGRGVEADSYIESRCFQARNVTKGNISGNFIVATDDAMIRLAGQNAGALCMSAGRFVDELKAVKKVVEYRVEAAMAKVNGHAIRPEKLRKEGTSIHVGRFGKRPLLIEDKRNKTKTKKRKPQFEDLELDIQVDEDENGIAWWMKLPEQE